MVTCSPCVEMRERIGWRWRQFNRESKIPAGKQSKIKNSFSTSHGQGDAQPSPGKLGFVIQKGDLARETLSL